MDAATTPKGRKTRRKILETAADLFHLRGVNGTSIDEVLEKSGTGKSQFYHYFESKDALLCEVVRLHLDRWLERVPAGRPLDTWAGIRAWFDGLVAWQRQANMVGG